MTRVVLILITFLPLALVGQQKRVSVSENETSVAGSIQAERSPIGNDGSSVEPKTGTDLGFRQEAKTPQQPTPKPPKNPKPGGEPGPEIPPSWVGYIGDAVVGSQIRIRFDAGFHNNAPDRGEFFYAQYNGISGPGPKFVVADLNFQQLYLNAEYAPKENPRLSFFAEVPVRWIQPQSTLAATTGNPQNVNEAGLSDVAAGFKLAALASTSQYLTFQFKAYFPSGSASEGLGTDHYSIEPALLYLRKLSSRMTLEAQVGDLHPIGGSSCSKIVPTAVYPGAVCIADAPPPALAGSKASFAGDVFFYGVGPSYVVYRGGSVQIAPVTELVGWRVLGGLITDNTTATPSFQQAVSADGTNIVNLKIGVRTLIGVHSSFYIGYGHQLTHAVWYKEIVRAEYRYSF